MKVGLEDAGELPPYWAPRPKGPQFLIVDLAQILLPFADVFDAQL